MTRGAKNTNIIEKELGIPGDYQYKALHSKNIFQADWHRNKWATISTQVKPKMRVLDLGTGSGNFELEFANKTRSIVGVDYNDEAISFLRKKINLLGIKNVKLIKSDIRKLKEIKISGKFDLVILVDVIEHIRSTEAGQLVKQITEYLNPNGKVCVITPNYNSPWLAIEPIFDFFKLVPHLKGEQHLAKYDPDSLRKLFEKNKYTVVEINSFNLFSWLIPNELLAKKFSRIELKSGMKFGSLVWGVFNFSDIEDKKRFEK